MNKAIIIGRTVRDTDTIMTKNEKKIGKLVVAVDTGYGENKETNFIPITVFGKLADFCEQYIGKGRLVSVEGRMRISSYEKKDGTKAQTFEVVADEIKALDKPKTEETPNRPSFTSVETDIPF